MAMSATKLGRDVGLTGQEMNFALKEAGFLDGQPGDWSVTDKGKPFAEEQHFHRGTGGYAQYNRYWTERRWDESVTDELDLSDERKQEIRSAVSTARRMKHTSEEIMTDDDASIYSNEKGSQDENVNNNDYLVEIVSVLLVAAATYGASKAIPYVKHWWQEKAFPELRKIKNKIVGQEE